MFVRFGSQILQGAQGEDHFFEHHDPVLEFLDSAISLFDQRKVIRRARQARAIDDGMRHGVQAQKIVTQTIGLAAGADGVEKIHGLLDDGRIVSLLQ